MERPYLTRSSINSRSQDPPNEAEPILMGYVKTESAEDILCPNGVGVNATGDLVLADSDAACFADPQIELGDVKVLECPAGDSSGENGNDSNGACETWAASNARNTRYATCDRCGPRASRKRMTRKRKLNVDSVSDYETPGGDSRIILTPKEPSSSTKRVTDTSCPSFLKSVPDSKHSQMTTKETENSKRAQIRPCRVRIERLAAWKRPAQPPLMDYVKTEPSESEETATFANDFFTDAPASEDGLAVSGSPHSIQDLKIEIGDVKVLTSPMGDLRSIVNDQVHNLAASQKESSSGSSFSIVGVLKHVPTLASHTPTLPNTNNGGNESGNNKRKLNGDSVAGHSPGPNVGGSIIITESNKGSSKNTARATKRDGKNYKLETSPPKRSKMTKIAEGSHNHPKLPESKVLTTPPTSANSIPSTKPPSSQKATVTADPSTTKSAPKSDSKLSELATEMRPCYVKLERSNILRIRVVHGSNGSANAIPALSQTNHGKQSQSNCGKPKPTPTSNLGKGPKLPLPRANHAKPPMSSQGVAGPAPLEPPSWKRNLTTATNSSDFAYKTFPIDHATLEFQAIKGFMWPLQLTSVEQVVNPQLWQQYRNQYKALLLQNSTNPNQLIQLGMMPLHEILRRVTNTERYIKDNPALLQSGPYSPNEALLLHPTGSKVNRWKIITQGLDETLGKQLHFSDDPIFISQIDKELFNGKDSDTGTIFIFTVLLGDSLSVDNLCKKGHDVIVPKKQRVQRRNHNDFTFDSVTARTSYLDSDNDQKFCNQYAIFDKTQCCPLYMITYRRNRNILGIENEYARARQQMPTVAWRSLPIPKTPMSCQSFDVSWPFFAERIYNKMSVQFIKPANCSEVVSRPKVLKKRDTTTANHIPLPVQPPDWDINLKIANHSISPSSSYIIFPIRNNTKEYQTIEQLMHPLPIHSVEQVVSPELWKRYNERLTEILYLKGRDPNMHNTIMKDHQLKAPSSTYATNDALLFHCPADKYRNLKKIFTEGLDEISGKTLERRMIFSDDPLLSIQCIQTYMNRQVKSGEKGNDITGTLLLFVVMLGDCLALDKCPVSVDELKKVDNQKRNSLDVTFDSATCTKSQSTELPPSPSSSKMKSTRLMETCNGYVIFNKYQCYPLYKIKYKTGHLLETKDTEMGSVCKMVRSEIPPIAWRIDPTVKTSAGSSGNLPEGVPIPMPNEKSASDWPFHASSLFQRMGAKIQKPRRTKVNYSWGWGKLDEQVQKPRRPNEIFSLGWRKREEQLEKLNNLGFSSRCKNLAALQDSKDDLHGAIDILLERESGPGKRCIAGESTRTPGLFDCRIGWVELAWAVNDDDINNTNTDDGLLSSQWSPNINWRLSPMMTCNPLTSCKICFP